MKEKTISTNSILISSILFCLLGIILIVVPTGSLSLFHFTISISMILLGTFLIIINIFKKEVISNTFIGIFLLFAGIFFFYNPTNFLVLFPILFSIYIFLMGIIKFSTFYIYKSNKFDGFIRTFFNAIWDFLFSFLILINPTRSIKPLTYILGFYFILVAITQFIDFLRIKFPDNFLVKRRRFRITLPTIISLFIPYTFYTKINKFLNDEVTHVKIDKNVSGNVDLEIFIGVKESLIGKFGHADLCFENKIYSYGHYDEESKRLFDCVGDGTLFIVNNREKYLRFCAEHSKKTIFAFGITLTDKQKEKK